MTLPLAVLAFALQAPVPAPAAAGPDAKAPEKTCKKGTAADCMTLAGMYRRGEGVPPDGGKAADFYEKACALNTAEGCFALAAMRMAAEGVKKDVSRAVVLRAAVPL